MVRPSIYDEAGSAWLATPVLSLACVFYSALYQSWLRLTSLVVVCFVGPAFDLVVEGACFSWKSNGRCRTCLSVSVSVCTPNFRLCLTPRSLVVCRSSVATEVVMVGRSGAIFVASIHLIFRGRLNYITYRAYF